VLRADTLEQRSDWALVTDRIVAMLSSYFGGLALLLASIGLYGLMSYSVSRRTSEIGVRMALGARPAGVLGLILTEVLWLVLGGVAAGRSDCDSGVAIRVGDGVRSDGERSCDATGGVRDPVGGWQDWPAMSRRGGHRGSIRWWRCDRNEGCVSGLAAAEKRMPGRRDRSIRSQSPPARGGS